MTTPRSSSVPAADPQTPRITTSRDDDGALVIHFQGRLDAHSVAPLWREAERLEHAAPDGALVVAEAGAVTWCDAVGAAMFIALSERRADRGGELELRDFPEAFRPLLTLVGKRTTPDSACPETQGVFESVGRYTVSLLADLRAQIAYTGELLVGLIWSLRHPRRLRWRDALRAAQSAGVNSLPVVALVCGLLGLVTSFQSAQVLREYGGETLLPLLVGRSMLRELGPLMTAVVLTARSGSAFAAEIGTMQVNEEVDALSTMGIDPPRFLIVPRVLAGMIMTPLLTMFANIAGIIGGGAIWVFDLDLPVTAYLQGLLEAAQLRDLIGGLGKSLVFGLLIAAVGCYRGLQTRGGAVAVGAQTTSAVVSGIVLIAVADSVFSVLFFYLDI